MILATSSQNLTYFIVYARIHCTYTVNVQSADNARRRVPITHFPWKIHKFICTLVSYLQSPDHFGKQKMIADLTFEGTTDGPVRIIDIHASGINTGWKKLLQYVLT